MDQVTEQDQTRTVRKTREGLVVSTKSDKTAVVAVERLKRHPLYGRVQRVTKKFHAHDENNECNVGDRVEMTECRPLSKLKHWRVSQILQRAK
ncbi:MAG: 30S ribosomal protein S17 [Abditibacteriaceae bacterium]